MDVSWPVAGSWALAACSALSLLAWWWVKREKRLDELRGRYADKLDELNGAEEAWRVAARTGTTVDVVRAKQTVEKLRGELNALRKALGVLCVLAVAAGCASTQKNPGERVVVVSDHAQIVSPGDTVPDYPHGESRWWLCTPTGLEMMVPEYKKEF